MVNMTGHTYHLTGLDEVLGVGFMYPVQYIPSNHKHKLIAQPFSPDISINGLLSVSMLWPSSHHTLKLSLLNGKYLR